MVSKRILPIQPPPTSQPIPIISKISEPILLTPPPKTPIIEPITKTLQVSKTLSHQQQHQQIPSPPSPSRLQTSPTPPPVVYAPQTKNLNTKTPHNIPSRLFDGHVSDGTPEGMFNYEPELVLFDPEPPPIIIPSFPSVFGHTLDQTKIDLTVSYPKPPKSSPNISKILRKFES